MGPEQHTAGTAEPAGSESGGAAEASETPAEHEEGSDEPHEEEVVEQVGGGALEEVPERL